MVYNGEAFFTLGDGSLVPEKWRDIYEWFGGRIAPKSWREALARTAPQTMTAVETEKEGFLPW